MRYFIDLSFAGTNYHGWQMQPNHSSVQEVIESKLSKMLKKDRIIIYGCGRTDAGVHAKQYFAHVDLPSEWTFDPVERLNLMLPLDIAIKRLVPMHDTAHAQYDANFRTYEYQMSLVRDCFDHHVKAYYPFFDLDLELMQEAADFLVSIQDFRSLCKVPDRHNHTLCNVTNVELIMDRLDQTLTLRIRANRFLQRMIRIIMWKLLQVGRGELTVEKYKSTILAKEIFDDLNPAHAQGLALTKIEYEYKV